MIETNLENSLAITRSKNDSEKPGAIVEQANDFYMDPIIIKRVNALKNIHFEMIKIETKFYEELHQLECKYAEFYKPLYERREKIVNGEYEPKGEETRWKLEEDIVEAAAKLSEAKENAKTGKNDSGVNDLMNDINKLDVSEIKKTDNETHSLDIDSPKGIPEFWLQAFKSTDLISSMMQEYDEPVLKHLIDIKVNVSNTKPYGFVLEFHFSDNGYFTNKVLTKSYEITCDMDDRDPFSYDGPIVYKCTGCTIDWIKGKDVTVTLVKKKQKHKNSGNVRIIVKQEKRDSFFNFFDTPTKDGLRPSFRRVIKEQNDGQKNQAEGAEEEGNEEEDEDDENLCEADFEIGHFFKEFLVPKAVLYFTGELTDEASYNEEEEEEEEFDEKELDEQESLEYGDYEEENDEDENNKIKETNGKKNTSVVA